MDPKKLITALGRMKVETGSMVCLGCGHEHNCGVRGCALIRAVQETLPTLHAENENLRAELEQVKADRSRWKQIAKARACQIDELEKMIQDKNQALDDVPKPISADERQISPGRQWEWLLSRFTRRED